MTWFIAVHILNDVRQRMSAFVVQAATGLLAIFILLVVMNWFFHKLYGTGWISLHNRRKRELLEKKRNVGSLSMRLSRGMAFLGFTSLLPTFGRASLLGGFLPERYFRLHEAHFFLWAYTRFLVVSLCRDGSVRSFLPSFP